MSRSRAAGAPTVVHGLAVILVVIAGLAACGPASTQVPPSGSAAVSSPEPISPVEGVITHVESAGLDRVSGFTLRTADGVLLDFMIGMLENGDEFPPGHLTEHQATSDPVRVFFTVEGGVLVATRLEDAGG